jgi:hypothetical protein
VWQQAGSSTLPWALIDQSIHALMGAHIDGGLIGALVSALIGALIAALIGSLIAALIGALIAAALIALGLLL